MSIAFSNVSHRFNDTIVLNDVSIQVEAGEILSILGPSGSGKSTLLRLAAGLESLGAGELAINEQIVASATVEMPAEERPAALVFQDHVLFPHLTVHDNVAFGMQSQDSSRVLQLLGDVGVAELAERYPDTLSGGQQQRVAIARALATEPDVMLLDEPFANVDVALRKRLREDARHALKSKDVATVLVTHDPDEAMVLGDRVACLVDGRIVQIGQPEELFRNPDHPFVAESVARAQIVAGDIDGDHLTTAFGDIEHEHPNAEVMVAILPGGVGLDDSSGDVLVDDIRFSEGRYIIMLLSQNQRLQVAVQVKPSVQIGDFVKLRFAPELIRVYPK